MIPSSGRIFSKFLENRFTFQEWMSQFALAPRPADLTLIAV